jgi:hypothetical protein
MARTSHNTSSTAIVNLTYDDDTGECFITFQDGRGYVIPKLPGIEFERLLNAESVGAYFNANIRGKY